jgi:hypothetical protein
MQSYGIANVPTVSTHVRTSRVVDIAVHWLPCSCSALHDFNGILGNTSLVNIQKHIHGCVSGVTIVGIPPPGYSFHASVDDQGCKLKLLRNCNRLKCLSRIEIEWRCSFLPCT